MGSANLAKVEQNQTDGLDSRVVTIKRTSKVIKGGRKFSFSALVVVGNRQGKIGFGFGKAKEISIAVHKASEAARRNMVFIPLKDGTLYHVIVSRHGATRVFMKPAAEGTGVIAGGAMRDLLEVLGVRNILGKIIGSTTPANVILATINGLMTMVTPESIADKRGKSLEEILGVKSIQNGE